MVNYQHNEFHWLAPRSNTHSMTAQPVIEKNEAGRRISNTDSYIFPLSYEENMHSSLSSAIPGFQTKDISTHHQWLIFNKTFPVSRNGFSLIHPHYNPNASITENIKWNLWVGNQNEADRGT